jgi:hypothetical protein
VAPLKNVKPIPRSIEAAAHATKGPLVCHMSRYSRVDASRVAAPSRYEARRPTASATTPVGTSKATMPTVKKAFAANVSDTLRPASSRNSVLMPQIVDEAKVDSSVNVTYVRRICRAAGFSALRGT